MEDHSCDDNLDDDDDDDDDENDTDDDDIMNDVYPLQGEERGPVLRLENPEAGGRRT